MKTAAGAHRLFLERFGRAPTIGAQAPGRVNLIGEHTDYVGGLVLPMAIDAHATVLAAEAMSGQSVLVASDLGEEVTIDLARPFAARPPAGPGSFANLILGVVDQFRKRDWRVPNLDLLLTSTVPVGAGLSSSAAIEVATATVLEQTVGVDLEPLDKALLCQSAEHEFVGTPCGIMDMLIATIAQAGTAQLIDCRTNESQAISMPAPDDLSILICNTGVNHALAASEYADRRATCEAVAGKLGTTLRDATISMIEAAHSNEILTTVERDRAAHVVLENVRTLLAARALSERHLSVFCQQMFESHASLRNLYEVSCPELDLVVDTAHHLRQQLNEPCLGARMTGGGFGGCAIVACPGHSVEAVSTVIRARFDDEFGRPVTIMPARPSGPTGMIEMGAA